MKRLLEKWRFALMSLGIVAAVFARPIFTYAQVPVPAVQESITVSTSGTLTEETLDGTEVAVTLAGRTFERSIFDIRRAVSVSGIAGVSVGTFGITRASDTRLTIELDFSGDFDEEGTLTFTVGAGAIASYSGAALTRDLSVPSVEESVEASTAAPLTEETLNGSVVTLTLAGRAFESSIFDVRDGVSVSGIAGVSVGTFGVQRVSDSRVTVELDFNGDIDSDGTLTLTVGADAIESYNGAALTAQLTVSAGMESVTASAASPLTEATLNGSVVTLTLSGARYESSIFDVRDGVSVSGIAGVSVGTFGVQRVSDTKVTVEISFNGDIDSDGTLTFTVGADAIANYSGSALTAQLPVTAGMESVTATTASPLTEATLNGSVVTLTLSGGRYASSTFDVRDEVSVSGIAGVTVGTFGIRRVSDTVVTVALTFSGDIDSDGTLTFTVGAGAIANYNGATLTDQVSVTALEETVVATTPKTLTEATLNGSVVTLTLTGRSYESSIFDVRRGVSVSGVAGVSVGTFGIQRASDSKVTVTLSFNGDIDSDGTLTFTVGAGAIEDYNGASLTAQLAVSAGMESVTASTASPLTEATLNGSVVTLTLAGGAFASSVFDVRRGVTVSGINGVTVGTFGVQRVSDTKVTVELTYSGDIDEVGTLTFTVAAGAIANYSGTSLTAQLTVNAEIESVTATAASPLTEATLDGSVVTLTLSGASYTRSALDIRDAVSLSGITGASIERFGIRRVSDTVTTAELEFNGDMDSDGTLTFTVGAGAIANYSGDPLAATLPVTAETGGGTNHVPTFSEGAGATRSFAENTPAGQNVGSPVTATDGDGGTLSYSLEGTDAASFDLVTTSGQLRTRAGVIYDYESRNRYVVTVRVSDGQGGSATIGVTINLTDVSEPPATTAPQLYWTHIGYQIQSANLDGSNVEDVVVSGLDGSNVLWGLALDVENGKIYWTDWGDDKIQRADLDGTNVEDLVTSGLDRPVALALDLGNGKVYWTDLGSQKIQRADLDGTNVEDLVTSGLVSPGGLTLDVGNGKMYWTDWGADKIKRADLDGTNVEDLVSSGLDQPVALALDLENGKMYWTDLDADKIQRADLDGSNVEDLVTGADGLDRPYSLVLAVAAAPTPPAPPGRKTADFNGDGIVNFADFFDFVDAFGTSDAKYDLDDNGIVNFADFFEFVDAYGTSG